MPNGAIWLNFRCSGKTGKVAAISQKRIPLNSRCVCLCLCVCNCVCLYNQQRAGYFIKRKFLLTPQG